jgi:hypothetical protein
MNFLNVDLFISIFDQTKVENLWMRKKLFCQQSKSAKMDAGSVRITLNNCIFLSVKVKYNHHKPVIPVLLALSNKQSYPRKLFL